MSRVVGTIVAFGLVGCVARATPPQQGAVVVSAEQTQSDPGDRAADTTAPNGGHPDGAYEVVPPPTPGQDWRPAGASSDGTIIGGLVAGQPHQAFVWKDGKTRLLGAVGRESGSLGYAISPDGGVVVGRSGGGTAFRWSAGKMTDLGKLPGYDRCAARAVSRNGARIAGVCWRSKPRPHNGKGPSGNGVVFVWDRAHGMRSLGAVLAAAGQLDNPWSLTECHGISADGATLVGNGHSATQTQEAWLAVLPMGK